MKGRLHFRVYVSGRARFVRVSIYERHGQMIEAANACYVAIPAKPVAEILPFQRSTLAATVTTPGSTERGCVAHVFLCWQHAQPYQIAHEVTHAALAEFAVRRISPMNRRHEETFCHLVTDLFVSILRRTLE